MFWLDASDQGWGAAVADQLASGLWSEGEELLSINHGTVGGGEGSLSAPEGSEGTCGSGFLRQHHSGGVSQASGGTLSPMLNEVAQRILR